MKLTYEEFYRICFKNQLKSKEIEELWEEYSHAKTLDQYEWLVRKLLHRPS